MLTADTIRELVRRGAARNPLLRSRLERAAFIVLMRRIEDRPEGGHTVESDSEVGKAYIVHAGACECPDYWRAPEGYCKHRLAVMMLDAGEALQRQRRQQKQRERLSDERVAVSYGVAFSTR
jgi:hypothetical protein